MANIIRSPGVYQSPAEQHSRPFQLGETGVPGFLGLTQRGPTNRPVRVNSVEEFERVFGVLDDAGYLQDAIKGFFSNGGDHCYVMRVAHMVRRGREETARASSLKALDASGELTLNISASSEGSWGNDISVQVLRDEPKVSTFLTLDLAPGDTSAVIKSSHGFSRGMSIRIFDGVNEAYRTVTELSGKTLSWLDSEPLEHAFRSGAPTYIEPVEFGMKVHWGEQSESFERLSLSPSSDRYAPRVINRQSQLVRVLDAKSSNSLPLSLPEAIHLGRLEGGTDGLMTVSPEDFIGINIGPNERYGLAAFEELGAIDLILAPDLMWTLNNSLGFRTEKDVEIVQQAMVAQCERLKTCFAILDFPDPLDHKRASQWRLLFDSSYAAFYFPWVKLDSRSGENKLIPPSGHVAGIFSKCDREAGVFRAPANEPLEGVIDLGRNLFDGDIGKLNNEGINCLKSFPHRGIRVWGARTVSSDSQWRFVNVRRIVSTVIATVEQGLQWSVFENNTPTLWKRIERDVSSYLRRLWLKGFFQGGSPEEGFYVKCNAETNPPEVRDAGMIVVECGVAPVRPAEYMVFRLDATVKETGAPDEASS